MKIIAPIILLIFLSSCQSKNKCIKLEERDFEINGKAEKEYESGNIENALKITNEAIKLNPKNYIAFSNRAAFIFEGISKRENLKEGERDLMVEDFKHSLEICDKFSKAQRNLIKLFYELKEFDNVIEYAEDYYKKFKKSSEILARLGDALYEKGEFEKAINYLDEALISDPVFNFSYIIRGKCYANLNEYDKAIDDLNKAIEIDSTWSLAYKERGYCYKKQNKKRLAQRDYFEALKVNPQNYESYFSLGVISVIAVSVILFNINRSRNPKEE